MATVTVPSIDQNICSQWSEQQTGIYNALPYYLVKMELKYRQRYAIWSKLVGQKRWTPNMGPIMRSVSKEPSPHIRQFFFPNEIAAAPLKDIIDVRERSVDAVVRRHRFESLVFDFVNDFRDFMTDHVMAAAKDINEKKTRAEDIFIRGNIFHRSPYVLLANKANGVLVNAPTGDGNAAGTDGKSTAWIQAMLPLVGSPGNLSLNTINLGATIMETDLNIAPFSGGGTPADNATPSDMYCLVTSAEAWNQFIYDPWLHYNKSIDLNIVTNGFKGNLFGRVTTKLEQYPIRIKVDGTFPQPEIRELNPAAFNYNESIPNPDYVNAPYEVAFLVGYGQGYNAIEVGPPPKQFAGNGMPEGFGKMFWNGEEIITKNILVPCQDAAGAVVWDTNKYGEKLQIISQVTYGIVGYQTRSVIPIIFKRVRGALNPILGVS